MMNHDGQWKKRMKTQSIFMDGKNFSASTFSTVFFLFFFIFIILKLIDFTLLSISFFAHSYKRCFPFRSHENKEEEDEYEGIRKLIANFNRNDYNFCWVTAFITSFTSTFFIMIFYCEGSFSLMFNGFIFV